MRNFTPIIIFSVAYAKLGNRNILVRTEQFVSAIYCFNLHFYMEERDHNNLYAYI